MIPKIKAVQKIEFDDNQSVSRQTQFWNYALSY